MFRPVHEWNLAWRGRRYITRMSFDTIPALHYAAEAADEADEGSAVVARIPLRRALLAAARAADHRISFLPLALLHGVTP